VTNSLISGYLERISSKVFDDYHEEITSLIGNQRGVYALYKKNHLYYVGLAKNLRTRVKQHLRDRHAEKWDGFSLYLIRNVEYLHELESLLIRISEPKGNMKLGGFKRSQNLIRRLKKSMEERNRRQVREILSGRKQHVRGSSRSKKRNVVRPGMRGAPPLKGLLPASTQLRCTYKGREYTSQVDSEGMIHIDNRVYNSPSQAAVYVTARPMNGWTFWKYLDQQGVWVKIDQLRSKK
jgi:hypothetical protein